MKKIPFVPQRDSMDCGVSCLAMIAEYYGLQSSEFLRANVSLDKNGISLLEICNIAEIIGFRTLAGAMTLPEFINHATLPCIVHWDQNHFVVVYQIKKKRNDKYTIYVADPGKGLLTYSEDSFAQHWINIDPKSCSKKRNSSFNPSN